MQLSLQIKKMCSIAGKYNREKGAYTPSSGQGAYVIKNMETIATDLTTILSLSNFGKLAISISKGQGNIPKVLWIAILPAGRTVGNSASVTICFGRQGEGIVAGLMVSKGAGHLHLSPVQRLPEEIRINVDGDRPGTKYSNCFINPKEWSIDELNDNEIVEHIRNSIEMLTTKEVT
jgi:hypothetical protein